MTLGQTGRMFRGIRLRTYEPWTGPISSSHGPRRPVICRYDVEPDRIGLIAGVMRIRNGNSLHQRRSCHARRGRVFMSYLNRRRLRVPLIALVSAVILLGAVVPASA